MSALRCTPLGLAVAVAVIGFSPAGLAQSAEAAGRADASLQLAVGSSDPELERAMDHGQDDEEPDGEADTEGEAEDAKTAAGAGFRGSFGRAFTEGIDPAWYGRLEMEAFSAASRYGAGPLGGAMIGGEVWTGTDGGGGGLPMTLYLALRSPALTTLLGGGFQLFVYDDVKDDAGFGIYAPQGVFAVGFDFGGLRILAEGRAVYRWQWGATDRGQVTIGLTVSQVEENLLPPRKRRSRARPE